MAADARPSGLDVGTFHHGEAGGVESELMRIDAVETSLLCRAIEHLTAEVVVAQHATFRRNEHQVVTAPSGDLAFEWVARKRGER